MLSRASILTLIGLAMALPGCATQEKQQLETKIKAEKPAEGADAIATRGAETFMMAPGLSVEQKQKLMAIHAETYEEASALRTELGQAKSLLFKTLSTPNYKTSQVDGLKKRIVELDRKRLAVMFKALDKVEGVLGRGEDAAAVYRHFDFDYDIHPDVRANY